MAKADAGKTERYRHRTSKVGLKADVTNNADVLDLVDDDPLGHAAVGALPSFAGTQPACGGRSDERELRT